MMELLTSPTFVGLAQAAGLGLLVILSLIGQRFGRKNEAAPPASKDVIIPSLAVADSQAITGWAETLREANRLIKDRGEFEREMLYETKRQNDYLEDIKHCIQAGVRAQSEYLEAIRKAPPASARK